MLELIFENEDSLPRSSFDLGHFTIKGNKGAVTSRNRRPDQSLMVYLSLDSLLTAAAKVLSSPIPSSTMVYGVDSSFDVQIDRLSLGEVTISFRGRIIAVVDEQSLVEAVGSCFHALMSTAPLPVSEAIYGDLQTSWQEFEIATRQTMRNQLVAAGGESMVCGLVLEAVLAGEEDA